MPDSDLYLDPAAGSPAIISIGGTCYQLVGPSPTSPNVSSFDASYSDCVSCSADDCPPSTSTILAGSYKELMDPCIGNNGETVGGTDGALVFSAFDPAPDPDATCYPGSPLSGSGCWDPVKNEGTVSGSIVAGGTVRITTDYDGTTVNNIYFHGPDGTSVGAQWQRV